MSGTGRLAAVAPLALALVACRSHASAQDAPPEPAAAAPSVAPVDHLAPDELVEGSDHAFGLTLPRGLAVAYTFTSVVYAGGPLAVHPVVQYLRPRLEGGGLHEGGGSATFDHVTVRGKPGVDLTIHVEAAPGGVRVELRDVTRAAALKLPDDAARMKQVGLAPNGRVLDPTHLD